VVDPQPVPHWKWRKRRDYAHEGFRRPSRRLIGQEWK
jgi:hypothetical protein